MAVAVGISVPAVTFPSSDSGAGGWVRPTAAAASIPSGSSAIDTNRGTATTTGGGGGSASEAGYRAYIQHTATTDTVTTRKIARDDGEGNLPGTQTGGYVDYVSPALVYFKPTDPYKSLVYESYREGGDLPVLGTWQESSLTDTWGDGSLIRVTYRPDSVTPQVASEPLPEMPIVINLTPYTSDAVVPSSIQFKLGGKTYIDRDGQLLHSVNSSGVGTPAGDVNYSTGLATVTDWGGGVAPNFALESLLTTRGQFSETALMFRTPGAPVVPGGFQLSVVAVDGEQLVASAELNGQITGDSTAGTIDSVTGVVDLRFGDWVADSSLSPEEKGQNWYNAANIVAGQIFKPRSIIPSTARFNAVIQTYIPLSSDILGLDPTRLPLDGKGPWVRVGDIVVVHNTAIHTAAATPGQTISVGRSRLARLRVLEAAGAVVPETKYSKSLDDGTITWANPLDLTGFTAPYSIEHTVEDVALAIEVEISGRITLNRPLTHVYPAAESHCSSSLVSGDLYAHVEHVFSQAAWTNVWSNDRIGANTAAQYNIVQYPILVTNAGAITERWRIEFTNAIDFRVIGEYSGQMAVGNKNADCAPLNPNNNKPYFTIMAAGWGDGWVAGNQLRFNTAGANQDFWILRTVLQGPALTGSGADQFKLQLRGDIDN